MFSDDLFDLLGNDSSSSPVAVAPPSVTTPFQQGENDNKNDVAVAVVVDDDDDDDDNDDDIPVVVIEDPQSFSGSTQTAGVGQENGPSVSSFIHQRQNSIPKAVLNGEQIRVYDYTGTWQETKTAYLIQEQRYENDNAMHTSSSSSSLFAYQNDTKYPVFKVPNGSIIFGVPLAKQADGSFRETSPAHVESSWILILQLQKMAYHCDNENNNNNNNNSLMTLPFLEELSVPLLETLQDDDYVYQIFQRTKEVMAHLCGEEFPPSEPKSLDQPVVTYAEEDVLLRERTPEGSTFQAHRGDATPVGGIKTIADEEEEEEDDVTFLVRTKEQLVEWLNNAYAADHTKSQSSEGRLETSLCEDVYCLVGVHFRTLRERLLAVDEESTTTTTQQQPQPELFANGVVAILKHLFELQIQNRDNFLTDFEACCAAANDFLRMSDTLEDILNEIVDSDDDDGSPLDETVTGALEEQVGLLLALYNRDAIFAAQKVHLPIMDTIEEAISEKLFTKEWLHELTHNELALTVVRTLEDFMEDLESFLDDVMVGKVLDALVTSTVICYAKCLVRMSPKHLHFHKSIWKSDNQKGLDRMRDDIAIMKEYFDNMCASHPKLIRIVGDEFEVLNAINELLSIAAGISNANLQDFVLLLHKKLQNVTLTKYVVGDLVHLIQPESEKEIYKLVDSMDPVLDSISQNPQAANNSSSEIASARDAVPGLRLADELMTICVQSQKMRIRPGLAKGTAEQGEIMLNMWSKQTTQYGVKMSRSIKKHSTEYSKNLTKTMASISSAGTSARKRVTQNMTKTMTSISGMSQANPKPSPNRSSQRKVVQPTDYSRSLTKTFTSMSLAGTSARKSVTKSMSSTMSSWSSFSQPKNLQPKTTSKKTWMQKMDKVTRRDG